MPLNMSRSSESWVCVVHITYRRVMPFNLHRDKLSNGAHNVWKWLKGGGLHSANRFAG